MNGELKTALETLRANMQAHPESHRTDEQHFAYATLLGRALAGPAMTDEDLRSEAQVQAEGLEEYGFTRGGARIRGLTEALIRTRRVVDLARRVAEKEPSWGSEYLRAAVRELDPVSPETEARLIAAAEDPADDRVQFVSDDPPKEPA